MIGVVYRTALLVVEVVDVPPALPPPYLPGGTLQTGDYRNWERDEGEEEEEQVHRPSKRLRLEAAGPADSTNRGEAS